MTLSARKAPLRYLIVALPALGMHHYFKHRLATMGLALQREVSALINVQFLRPVPHAH